MNLTIAFDHLIMEIISSLKKDIQRGTKDCSVFFLQLQDIYLYLGSFSSNPYSMHLLDSQSNLFYIKYLSGCCCHNLYTFRFIFIFYSQFSKKFSSINLAMDKQYNFGRLVGDICQNFDYNLLHLCLLKILLLRLLLFPFL